MNELLREFGCLVPNLLIFTSSFNKLSLFFMLYFNYELFGEFK